jgi:capsid portal protein
MYIFIVLILIGVKANGTATLSFVFPVSEGKEIIREVEEISEPLVRVNGVAENDEVLEIDLISRKGLEFAFDVLYDDGSIQSYSGAFIDGCKKLEVPVVLGGSRRKIRWVNILWEGDGLVVCNASHENASYENLPDLSCTSQGQFEKD